MRIYILLVFSVLSKILVGQNIENGVYSSAPGFTFNRLFLLCSDSILEIDQFELKGGHPFGRNTTVRLHKLTSKSKNNLVFKSEDQTVSVYARKNFLQLKSKYFGNSKLRKSTHNYLYIRQLRNELKFTDFYLERRNKYKLAKFWSILDSANLRGQFSIDESLFQKKLNEVEQILIKKQKHYLDSVQRLQ